MKTKTRRLLQPVWTALERSLGTSRAILGVSGGADSRALLEAVAHWPLRHAGLHVVSIDHGVRPESRLEAEFVRSRAVALGFDASCHFLKPEQAYNEASLRRSRYEALWAFAECFGADSLVLAHTQDDLAEGFLMDLMGLGGGSEGAAMPEVSLQKRGRLLRPLLGFSRAYLIAVLTELGQLDYFEDPTNYELIANRAKVRDLLKLHRYPVKRLAQLAERRRLEGEALDQWASELLVETDDETVGIRNEPACPKSVRVRALKQALGMVCEESDFRSSRLVIEEAVDKSEGVFDLPIVRLRMSPGVISLERK